MEQKPPPIRLGVVGIEPTPIMAKEPDWSALVALPPFQMFARERSSSGRDDLAHANSVIAQARSSGEGAALMSAYEAWHAAKGFWPNETPFGELKE